MSSKAPVITGIDIETCPGLAYVWGLRDVGDISLNMLHSDFSLLSFAAKRLDRKAIIYRDNRDAKDPRDDKGLMVGLWTVLNETSILYGHNIKQFDIKRINSRFAVHGFPPPSPYKVVDTLSEARRHFGFPSNKLEYLAGKLTQTPKMKHAKFPGFELWKACLAKNPAAWEELERYNKQDVIATEELYLKIRGWADTHPHVGLYKGDIDLCPKCGSNQLQHRGYAFTQAGKYQRLRCNECLGWSRGRKNMIKKGKVA